MEGLAFFKSLKMCWAVLTYFGKHFFGVFSSQKKDRG